MAAWARFLVLVLAAISVTWSAAEAKDLKINLPRRSESTPVQRLNREGVEAIRKHQFNKAKDLFYKAYLYDPGDPFTLNNLGYIAELEGQVERAHEFYSLAAEQGTDAVVDRASSKKLEGEPFRAAVGGIGDLAMRVNRDNVEAVRLLAQGRAPEADLLLQRTLSVDPHNGFTVNNMGVAKEMEGEYEQALRYYDQVASAHSNEPVIVTLNASWRGKPLSEMAAASAKRIRGRLHSLDTPEAKAALLNLRAVSAINRNDWQSAEPDFRQAYKLDPSNAFTLNNIGFLSEMGGDLETAQFFYDKAQDADGASQRVGRATRHEAEGMKVSSVADDSSGRVETTMQEDQRAKSQETGPIRLKRRDGQPVVEPETPPAAPKNEDQPR